MRVYTGWRHCSPARRKRAWSLVAVLAVAAVVLVFLEAADMINVIPGR